MAPSSSKLEAQDSSALSRMFDEPEEETTASSQQDDNQEEDNAYENELLAAWNKAQEKERNEAKAREQEMEMA